MVMLFVKYEVLQIVSLVAWIEGIQKWKSKNQTRYYGKHYQFHAIKGAGEERGVQYKNALI
eukprot:scaffold6472_cov75-Cylindrotheca_fusiformis.AAC.6